ncbi:hypothetical protein CEXT_489291 [Caerostris extrusa]|uniref:Uncharacterized protein n=1 Tax=Caerostris extrusa TaxID=172846 RepID=A0AAV4UZD8_CAEEX|nr:hypothetical protein CEXT_489291 [Caerostris extrusa]
MVILAGPPWDSITDAPPMLMSPATPTRGPYGNCERDSIMGIPDHVKDRHAHQNNCNNATLKCVPADWNLSSPIQQLLLCLILNVLQFGTDIT